MKHSFRRWTSWYGRGSRTGRTNRDNLGTQGQRHDRGTLTLEVLESRELLAANAIITEFMARNDGGLRDGLGQSPDWIEIFNAGDEAVDLAGYRLTDSAAELSQWTFPSTTLESGQYLVVFASGQTDGNFVDPDGNLHTSFTLQRSGEYLALIAPDGRVASEFGSASENYPAQLANVSFGVAQSLTLIDSGHDAWYWVPGNDDAGLAWTQPGFDAAAGGFTMGTAAIGFETRPNDRVNFSDQIQTELPANAHAAYVLTRFALNDATAVSNLQLDLKYDNGFVAYLNGVKVAEANAPSVLGWFATATDASRRDAEALEEVRFDLSGHVDALVNGTNVLAFHALNSVTDNSDMLLVPRLTASVSDMLAAVGTKAKAGYMPAPTPGGPNSSNDGIFAGFVEDTQFSVDRGFYDEPFQVEITTGTADAEIRYTTDGSEPTRTNGQMYQGPIRVTTTTNLRAAAFKDDFLSTNVDTQTYIFVEDVIHQPAEIAGFPFGGSTWAGSSTYVPQDSAMDPDVVNDPAYRDVIRDSLKAVPTISITSDINNIFGDAGWYDGENVEHPVSVEVIYADDPGGSHQANGGIESHSHDRLKRSLRLNFREEYGDPKMHTDLFQRAPLFGNTAVDEVDRIILRAGNNRSWARIWNPDKTAYTTDSFYRDTQLAMSGYGMRDNFAHLYINGVYWGLYNPTERADSFFTSAYFGGRRDDWFAVNHGGDLSGDSARYDYLRRTLIREDMTDPAKYAELQEYLDVEGFADYLIISWWMAVSDWPQNNWYAGNRNDSSDLGPTPLRFFAWDGEWAWGQGGQSSSTGQAHVHADFRANRRGSDVITTLWHGARVNDDFMMMFADRVYRHLFNDGVLTEENAKTRWTTLTEFVRDAVVAESARWGDSLESAGQPTRTRDVDWQNEVNRVLGLMTGNNQVFIDALRAEGYYSSIDPPTANRHGGVVPAGFEVTLDNPNSGGAVYYTTDGSDPRAAGDEISSSAILYTGAVKLSADTTLMTRALADGEWSALDVSPFRIASSLPLRITEINFNPHDANPVPGLGEMDAGNDRFEFIELANVGNGAIDLTGVKLVETEVDGENEGIRFTFASGTLGPGERIVAARDRGAFQSRYGSAVRLADGTDGSEDGNTGQYGGRLSNNGEWITLVDAADVIIQQFEYRTSENWPARASGGGSSIEIVDPQGDYSDPANWRASAEFGGSPGTAGRGDVPSIVINEVLPDTSQPNGDQIELYNTTSRDVDVNHWWISNSADDYFKFRVASPTVVSARGYRVFSEAQLGFGFDGARGDEVWLIESDATGRPLRFVDHVQFGTTAPEVSLGPGPGPNRNDPWIALAEPTLGGPNSPRRIGDVVISEVYFNPADPDGDGRLRANNFEYIELYNRSGSPVDVGGWRLTGVTEFTFEPGTVLEANSTLLVMGFDPDRGTNADIFRFTLLADPATVLVGRYTDPLDDVSGEIQLVRPVPPPADRPDLEPLFVEDSVAYATQAPWPASTAGPGDSLSRTRPSDHGELPTSWVAKAPSPGTVAFFERIAGDANDDGKFDQLDITLVLQGGKYLTGRPATWSEGDWTGDGLFDQADVVAALLAGRYLR